VNAWARRRNSYETTIAKPVFITPTLLKWQEEEMGEAARQKTSLSSSRTPSMVIGELAHRFLESWDFAESVENSSDRIESLLDQWLPSKLRQEQAQIHADLAEILKRFFGSKIYGELATSQILGREVPLLMPWDGQIMEGVIDLVYEHNGMLYLADYKTDRIAREDLVQGAARYHQQAQVYSRAVRQSLQKEIAAFKVIFLRLGEVVPVPLDETQLASHPIQLTLL
jgi:ATP-dependent helicase/nuclease subunit A